MLWLCLYFPRLPAEALNLHDETAVVVAHKGARRWLVTDAAGVKAGTPLSVALSLEPRLQTRLRQPAAERERLRALAHALYRYGSPVCTQIIEPQDEGQLPWPLLWVEVGESLSLHDGLEPLLDALCADLIELGTSARMAVAPTRLGGALLARAGDTLPVTTLRVLHTRLAPLPLALLPWPEGVLETLRGLGLRSLGAVLKLPRVELARRIGAHWILQLDRILGRAAHPFQAIHLPPRFERRFEFFQEVESVEGLLFPLRRLCMELQHYLRARESGVCALRLEFLHAQGRRSGFTQRYALPTRDGAHLFSTLRERLLRLKPGEPVRELRLHADDFMRPAERQMDWLEGAGRSQQWQQAIERLRARLGEKAVWIPACTGDHRPERAWCVQGEFATAAPAKLPTRPAWLLREPRLIAEPRQRAPEFERIASGWWDGQPVRRDYYVADVGGGRAWVFQDLETQQWFLHGWWA